ncbi:MAG TPA: dihydrolipoamide acetyltransferase family protein [Chloroflexota bacterium]|jgi:2-oxoisovalerate dehydrogenase E2 component (dihydrolipoyl transacylase)
MPNTVVQMPQLGESVSEGTIGRWLKQPGDRVERDEPLVEIQTDKVNAEVPSPVAGILQQILLPEGTTAAVKSDMAIIGDEAPQTLPSTSGRGAGGEGAPSFTYDSSAGGGVVGHRDEAPQQPEPNGGPPKRFYTPVVLRMAEEHNIDLASIEGTGAHGRVTRKDVERAIAGQPAAPPPPQPAAPAPLPSPPPASAAPSVTRPAAPAAPMVTPAAGDQDLALTPMRRAIADHMARARADIPDAWSLVEIDMTRLSRHRDTLQSEWQAREGYELTYLPFFVKAVLAGLRAVPEMNASWAGDHVVVHREYNLGIAVSVPNGLIVPVLRGAEQLSVSGVAQALRALIVKARSGRLAMEDLQGATFTVNNPGSLGSIMSQPIVPVGQSGIVTMEAIVKRPVVTADDAIAVRSMMYSCLSFDHRILDGSGALTFLKTLKHELETVDYPLY